MMRRSRYAFGALAHAGLHRCYVRQRTAAASGTLASSAVFDKESLQMRNIRILGIVGSLRKDSYNRFALQAAQELVPAGAVLDLIELHRIPVFDQDNELVLPASVIEFKRRIQGADAVLFATPEYNYSLPGGLKNAIDWASRPYGESAWLGKPAGIMGASVGSLGTARAQYHLRQILVAQDMPVVNQPEVMIGNAAQRFDSNGKLTDETTRQLIQKLMVVLVALARGTATRVHTS
jgi:chromate reductase